MDFINGNNFSEIADWIIEINYSTLDSRINNQDGIIYCKTDFIDQLFNIIRFSSKKYILITHMSDYPIDNVRFQKVPPCIVKWYAQNAIYENNKLIPIPIGLENHKGFSKGKFTNHEWISINYLRLQKKLKQDELYCNWNNTNPDRNFITSKLKENKLNIFQESGLSYENYCESMSNFKWVICPPGNGVDTHRTWEALYLGCYPIVLKHRIFKDYDLPILQVENWQDINSDILQQHEDKWKDRKNFEQLYMNYWRKRIKQDYYNLNFT